VIALSMSTLQEIKSAIAKLPDRERALLAAELCAADLQPDAAELEAALDRGLRDVEAGRIQELASLQAKLGGWTSKS
jgi:predicted transcriptional regulator